MKPHGSLLPIALAAALAITSCTTTSTVDQPNPSVTQHAAVTTTAPSEITTVTDPEPATTTTIASTVPLREVVTIEITTRRSWGALPPDTALPTHDVDLITIHHTAREHDDTPMEERLRRWQTYHQSVGFGDIAYHMIIAADGTIYEGRDFLNVGSTRTAYNPTGHFLPTLDGMFDEFWDSPNDDDDLPDGADELSTEQLASLIDLLAWASVEFDIPPEEIGGHRDYAATACPGSVVHEMLQTGEIASIVAQRIVDADFRLVYVDR